MKIISSKKEFVCSQDKPYVSGHASTLIVLSNGDVLVAWFGGSWEKGPDTAIWMARRRADGFWERPKIVADERGIPHWNPVLFQDNESKIVLYYKVGTTISEWKTYVKYSNDGHTFSKAEELVQGDVGGRGPVKNKPIIATNGDILAPASLEGNTWDCFVDISHDNGKTWIKSEFIPLRRIGYNLLDTINDKHDCYGKGTIQPTLWESRRGVVHALMRSTSSVIFRSDSYDGGKNWSLAYQSGLPNNNSGIDLVKTFQDELALVWNPVGNHPNYYKGPRTPLILSASLDNGHSWETVFEFENTDGEYSYPAIVQKGDKLYITYTWKRKNIVFWELTMEC
jgi:predicted neuraminidase